ncbi:MAG TPA: acyl-CoA dehydrogenase family protein [Polyangiales bacterium]|nr:acyl-CoA dehydrogenase family protein [Polyangiales bacterium]
MTELDAFRSDVRKWLEASVPQSLHGRPMAMAYEGAGEQEPPNIQADRARYLKAMISRGYTAPTWPEQYGGGGLSNPQARVLQEELGRLKVAPALMSMGLQMIGPTLLVHGTEAQKQRFLPGIIRGETRWCQGFSEPGAGSDLASLRTAAKLDAGGKQYVINGSKIWTSGAHLSDWIFMLVRTDETSKHNGITFILVDMKTPGIEVKPIKLISGHSMFCEVFFNDVVAEAQNVVGAVNQGWTVAKTLLNFERSGMGTGGGNAARRGSVNGNAIIALAKESVGEADGKLANPTLRDKLASLLIDEMALALTVRRSAETQKATGAPGPEISMFKLCQSELGQRRDELMLRLRGTAALGWEGPAFSTDDLTLTRAWLSAKATTIYGGTSEIQRNIIAKRVLKLPSGN